MNRVLRGAALLLGIALALSATMSPGAPAAGFATETLALTFVSPSLGWRVSDRWDANSGARGPLTVNRSTDGGSHWTFLSTLPRASSGGGVAFNVYVSLLLFANSHDGWLYGNALFATHDGGRSWRRLPLLGTETTLSAVGSSVWRLDWSCRQTSAVTCKYTLLASGTGSDTWKAMAWHPPEGATIGTELACSGRGHAWLVRGTLEHTRDGGHTWGDAIPITIADPGGGGVGPVQFVDPRHGWLFSFPNLLFRTIDGGRRWRELRLH